jgi:uncharacterized membrane protein
MDAPASRQSAQHEADRLRFLREQLAQLEREGVFALTDAQKQQLAVYSEGRISELAKLHDIDVSDSQRRLSWGLRIASTLGGFAICAAAVFFFLQFWGYLSTWTQVTILIALPLLALAATEFTARRERSLYFAAILALVAVACFAMNLAALGAIFNLTSTQNAFLVWCLFSLLLAYRYGLRVLLVVGLAFGMSWVSATACTWFHLHWLAFPERPELLLATGFGVALFGMLWTRWRYPEFAPVYRLIGSLVFFVSVLFLAGSGRSSFLDWDHKSIQRFYEVVLLSGAAGAMWVGIRRNWTGLVNTGAVFFTIELYLRLHRWLWDSLPKYVFFAMIGSVAIVVVWTFKRFRERLQTGVAR